MKEVNIIEEENRLAEEDEYDIGDIGEATEDIAEVTDDIHEDTNSIDKKTTWLIILWLLDKVIMAGLIIFLGR